MKTYIEPKVDFITLAVKNDICVAFGTNAASPVPQNAIKINSGGTQIIESE